MNTETRPAFIVRHPWIFVLAAFALLLSAWATLIVVAVKSSPAPVELNR